MINSDRSKGRMFLEALIAKIQTIKNPEAFLVLDKNRRNNGIQWGDIVSFGDEDYLVILDVHKDTRERKALREQHLATDWSASEEEPENG